MNVIIVFLISLLNFTTTSEEVGQIGIYFLREDMDNCQNTVVDHHSKLKYCAGNEPIIGQDSFADVSEIYLGEKASFFQIGLTIAGQRTLESIVLSKTSIKLGLAYDDQFLGFIDIDEVSNFKSIKIFAPTDKSDLVAFRARLTNKIEH